MKWGFTLVASAALALPATANAAPQATREGDRLLSLGQAKQHYNGRLSKVVLEFLTVMDRVVNQPKQPTMTAAAWAPLGQLVDREKFRRVGNYGVRNDWPSYSGLLTQWSNSSWWKGYIWRLREVPDRVGRGGLVYLESEERSNRRHPVREDGDYATLASIAVYEIDGNGKITRLHVYDQRPLDR
jgi:hypothetical protein